MEPNGSEIILTEDGRAGLVRLNRPKALNAVTLGMIRELEKFYLRIAKTPKIYGVVMEAEGKAFSAGGDIRAIYETGRTRPEEVAQYYAEEYQHNWTLDRLMKPHIALINGVVMGGGVGISIYGTHRVAGETYRFAMPETGIGFFPDIGGGWFLSRLRGKAGLYLALTGRIIGQADAFYLGLATHCVSSENFPIIRLGVIEGEPIDHLLAKLHEPPATSETEALQAVIDRLFSAPSLTGIFTALEQETGDHQAFAHSTLETLLKRSPLSLKVTFEQIRRGAMYADLKEALAVEYRLARRFLAEPDLYEGIRAVIIDKDHSPKWKHGSIQDISDAEVEGFFAPLPEGDLALTDYWKQA